MSLVTTGEPHPAHTTPQRNVLMLRAGMCTRGRGPGFRSFAHAWGRETATVQDMLQYGLPDLNKQATAYLGAGLFFNFFITD